MSDKPTAARNAYGHLAPKFAEVTDEVLFGDIWRQPGLSPRDRSVVTVSSLISLYRINELPYHVK
ncbi:MAG: carboxymuconolactone decarboxylase family protein, partial [Sphingomonadales bacterium]